MLEKCDRFTILKSEWAKSLLKVRKLHWSIFDWRLINVTLNKYTSVGTWHVIFLENIKVLLRSINFVQNKIKPVNEPTAAVIWCSLLFYWSWVYNWLEWMKITQNTERETIAMLIVVQNLGVRKIILTSDNITRRRRGNVMWTIKLICRCRMFFIKIVFNILKYLLKLYSSSTATACTPKTTDTEMDPSALLSVSVTVSSLISGYRSINQHVNFSVCICVN